VKSYEDTTEKLKEIEAQILRKRNELRQFETEYRRVGLCLIVMVCKAHGDTVYSYNFLVIFYRHWHAFKR
jgi:hypothetical protein